MIKNNKGFTLLEMLIVLAVIAILVLLFVPNLTSQKKGIDQKGDEAFRKAIETQVELYYLKEGSYPTSLQDLKLSADQEAKASKMNPPISLTPNEKE